MRRALLIPVLSFGVLYSCSGGKSGTAEAVEHHFPDTLRVATLYSPTSYFIYREEEMGYDYSLARQFAQDKGLVLDLHIATSLGQMIQMLDSGQVDLLAYEIPLTGEFKQGIIHCGPQTTTHQVLVQPRQPRDSLITDPTQLVGRDVWVEEGSKYQYRLQNLNSEIGGGITIHTINRDTLITEDLIDMVSTGQIPLTVVDSDIARLNATYYRDLDVSLPLSLAQRASWGVAPSAQWLADSIDAWLGQPKPRQQSASLLKRYFELSKDSPRPFHVDFSHGHISPFDPIFQRTAATIGWDWRILAAQGYHESHFDSTRTSWAGARGIMQLMPGTARAYGLPDSLVTNPEANIEAAGRVLRDLERTFARRVSDPAERTKFVLAAYNAGLAHILDAIALASKYGKNPQVWEGNVAASLLLKAHPEYYSDSICRAGYFRGRQTVAYVDDVMKFYNTARQKVPLHPAHKH